MGIDAQMRVVLRVGSDREILNERIKTIHDPEDLVMDQRYNLILGNVKDLEGSYLNIFDVNVSHHRYYGIGYERGPILRTITQIEWLRAQPEVITIYYYGDVHDEPIEFTKEDSIELLFHFFKVGESPYRGSAIGRWSKR